MSCSNSDNRNFIINKKEYKNKLEIFISDNFVISCLFNNQYLIRIKLVMIIEDLNMKKQG